MSNSLESDWIFGLALSGQPLISLRGVPGDATGEVEGHLTATTLFVGVDAATLSGKRVEVEGTMANGVLTATKIKLEV